LLIQQTAQLLGQGNKLGGVALGLNLLAELSDFLGLAVNSHMRGGSAFFNATDISATFNAYFCSSGLPNLLKQNPAEAIDPNVLRESNYRKRRDHHGVVRCSRSATIQ